MKRRTVLASAAAGTALLAAPRIGSAQAASTLKFVPQADLANLDPIWSTSDVSRNHGHAVFDSLYGMDATFVPKPQMVEGAKTEQDGKLVELTLRDGLKFHDGTPVLARDCVASIERWSKRDAFGGVLIAATDELSAPSDKVIRFRLNKPFSLLPDALATPANMAAMMPERLAKTDPYQQVTEMVGSGPFRFLADERVSGSRVVYQKFDGYVPRQEKLSFTTGGKVAHVQRVEWTVVPDPATSAGALASGEFDWWENPTIDLVPQLKRNANITVVVKDTTGEMGCMRFNQLFPPFDNPAIRRIVLGAINQKDVMEAVAGGDPSLIKVPNGIFANGTKLANDAGLDLFKGNGDPEKIKQALAAAGYKGEKIAILAASDFPTINAMAQVAADVLKRIGFNVDYQSLDWGTVVQRRASKEPPDKGGWNIFFTFLGGVGNISPAAHLGLRSNGAKAWFGWPDLPKLEAIRLSWFDAPDLAAQQKIARAMQLQAFEDVPYVPMGMYDQPTAFRKNIAGIPDGFPQFYGVTKG